MGTMYVLEGAMPGIRQSVRSLPAGHPAHGPANRFVQGYGEHTGTRWKDFLTCLDEFEPMLWPIVVTGAAAAFFAFETHFSQQIHVRSDVAAHG